MATKNANAKTWAIRPSLDGLRYSAAKNGQHLYEPPPLNGLIFPSNNVANSDIGIDFTGANMVPRIGHTILWKANYTQHTGFYAWCWHVWADNAWHAGMWELGRHPYPATGTVNGSGQSTGGTSSSGTVHFHEQAGIGANDFLASPGGSALLVTKGIWYLQAATCEYVTVSTADDTVRSTFWPDIEGDPDFSIVSDASATNYDSHDGPSTPPTMKFRFGASPWTATGSANEETPSGKFRYLMQYSRALSLSEILTKFGLNRDDTTDPDRWYSNINPTPSDVSDKSGMGHNPSWANANRPTLYTG